MSSTSMSMEETPELRFEDMTEAQMAIRVDELVRKKRIEVLQRELASIKRGGKTATSSRDALVLTHAVDCDEVARDVLDFRRNCTIITELIPKRHRTSRHLFGPDLYGISISSDESSVVFVDPQLRKDALRRTSVSEIEQIVSEIKANTARRQTEFELRRKILAEKQLRLRSAFAVSDEWQKRAAERHVTIAEDVDTKKEQEGIRSIVKQYITRKREEAIQIISEKGACDRLHASAMREDMEAELTSALDAILYRFMCRWPFLGHTISFVYCGAGCDADLHAEACGTELAKLLGLNVVMEKGQARVVSFLSPEWQIRAIDEMPGRMIKEELYLANSEVTDAGNVVFRIMEKITLDKGLERWQAALKEKLSLEAEESTQ